MMAASIPIAWYRRTSMRVRVFILHSREKLLVTTLLIPSPESKAEAHDVSPQIAMMFLNNKFYCVHMYVYEERISNICIPQNLKNRNPRVA